MNTRYEHYDEMGASITFDQPFFIGALCISIGLAIGGFLDWYWCIAVLIAAEILSWLYKWFILDKVMILFRRPNPTK